MDVTEARITVSHVRKGMFVSQLDRPWLETPFPLEGFHVRNEQQLRFLREHCKHVWVDLTMGEAPDPRFVLPDVAPDEAKIELEEARVTRYARETELREEMEQAREIHGQLSEQIGEMMRDLREGKNLDFEAVKEGVDAMIDSVVRNPDAFALLIELRKKDVYAYRHAMGTSIWAATFGRHLGMPRERIRGLAQGGLLLDVGKTRLPLALLNKTGTLSEEEMALMESHVAKSLEIIDAAAGEVPAEVRDMVATHHEKFDGSGYPAGLRGMTIPLAGRIARIVDSYDALTSSRVYATPMSPHGAVNVLYEWRGMDYQAELVEQFIQVVGIYPTGTLVELSTGEIGVIISLNGAHRLHPRVMLILDADKAPYDEFRELDLREFTDSETPVTIRRGLPPGTYGVDPEEMFL